MELFLWNICQGFGSHLLKDVFIKAFLKWKASYEGQVEHKNDTEETRQTPNTERQQNSITFLVTIL